MPEYKGVEAPFWEVGSSNGNLLGRYRENDGKFIAVAVVNSFTNEKVVGECNSKEEAKDKIKEYWGYVGKVIIDYEEGWPE